MKIDQVVLEIFDFINNHFSTYIVIARMMYEKLQA